MLLYSSIIIIVNYLVIRNYRVRGVWKIYVELRTGALVTARHQKKNFFLGEVMSVRATDSDKILVWTNASTPFQSVL